MANLKLFHAAFSNNALRARLYLAERGIEYVPEDVNLLKAEHKAEEYVKVNPRGAIPCLVDGDVVVRESTAIIEYLETKQETPLLPTEPKDLARCLIDVAEYHQKLEPCNILGSVIFGKQDVEKLGERVPKLLKELKLWDAKLEGREYLANTFSKADIIVFPFIAPMYHILKLPTDFFPNLYAWYERVKARPAASQDAFWEAFTELAGNVNPGAAIFAGLAKPDYV